VRRAIAHPNGLVIHTDACKGLEVAVDNVFPGVEHRECMCHLAANFVKKYKGKVYTDNLWPASLTCSVKKHNYHLRQLYTNPKVKEYLETHHSK
jgi:transposase-like protein